MYYMLNLCLLTPTIFSYMLFLIIKYYYMLPPCLAPEEDGETLFQEQIVARVWTFSVCPARPVNDLI